MHPLHPLRSFPLLVTYLGKWRTYRRAKKTPLPHRFRARLITGQHDACIVQQEITHRYQANLASSRGYEALFASLMTFPTVPREESWDKEHVSINFMTTILRYRSTNVLLVLFAVDQPPTTGAQATTTPLFPVPADPGSHNTKAQ